MAKQYRIAPQQLMTMLVLTLVVQTNQYCSYRNFVKRKNKTKLGHRL